MSFIRQQITIGREQKQPTHPRKVCSNCEESRIPEGGIEMGPGRWVCASCWAKRASRKQGK